MRTAAERAWLKAMFDTDSETAASGLMQDWYLWMKRYHPVPLTLIIEAYLQARDWRRAWLSLERTYGRDSQAHRFLFLMLEAVLEKAQSAAVARGTSRAESGSDALSDTEQLMRAFGR